MMEFFEDARNFVTSFFEPDINGMKARGDAIGLVRLLFSEKYAGKASEILGKMGAPAVEPLVAALRSKGSGEGRSRAADLLGTLKDARALKPLLGALTDFDWRVRQKAAEALGKLKDEQALEPLMRALRDPEWRVRANAAEALGKFSDSRVVPALEAACKDVYYIVRYTAVEALGQVGTKASIDVVRAALKDPDSVARNKAVWALGRLGTEAMLLEVLKEADPILRGAACYTLAKLHPATALEPLLAAIQDPDAGVRYYAVAGIAEIGDKPARKALAELATSSPDEKVRKEAQDRMSSKGWQIPEVKAEL